MQLVSNVNPSLHTTEKRRLMPSALMRLMPAAKGALGMGMSLVLTATGHTKDGR